MSWEIVSAFPLSKIDNPLDLVTALGIGCSSQLLLRGLTGKACIFLKSRFIIRADTDVITHPQGTTLRTR